MNQILSEEMKAKLAEAQTTCPRNHKAFIEFMMQDYADHVKRIAEACKGMNLLPTEFMLGYLEAVAVNITAFAGPKKGLEKEAAKVAALAFEALLLNAFEEHK